MVEMELLGVRLELPANAPVVLLREQQGERRVLPIYIGPEEARAIALALEGVSTPRPMTHDLLRDVLRAVDARVVSIMAFTVSGGRVLAIDTLGDVERLARLHVPGLEA